MDKRKLGALETPAIGLGCMGMSIAYGPADEAGAVATLHHALDRGATMIDTSDMYGFGHNETLIGETLKDRRGEMILATKFGNRKIDGKTVVDGRPEWVVEACEASLRRLQTDVIDLYYAHRIDPSVPIEDTVGAMAGLVEAGKVRHLGLSEAAPETIRRAAAVHPIAAVQSELSLWTRDMEAEVIPTCRELGIGFVAYAPLGRGFLSGTIPSRDALIEEDRRRAHPRFAEENIAANTALLGALTAVAADLGASPAQVALAWVLAKGDDIMAIPGTKKVKWLDENIAAADIALSPDQIARLETVFAPGATQGARYPEAELSKLMR